MDVKKVSNMLIKMENRSKQMLMHAERTAQLCYALGQEIDLESDELEIVYLAGLFHEIGKIGLPDEIKLREEAVELEKIYPYFSTVILNCFDEYSSLEKVVMQHQENIDGSGYPNGLRQDEIDLLAIIVRISDYYDTKRMEGLTHDDACKALRLKSDIIFPRRIITPFIKSIIKNELQFEYDTANENNDD